MERVLWPLICIATRSGMPARIMFPDKTFSHQPYLSVNAGKDGNIYVIDRVLAGGLQRGQQHERRDRRRDVSILRHTSVLEQTALQLHRRRRRLKSWRMDTSCNPGPV